MLVIVVESDEAVRDSIRSVLTAEHVEVADFPSAEACLKGFFPADYRCLIVDLDLPGISGHDLIRVLRQRDGAKPAVLMRSSADNRDPRSAHAGYLGISLRKPFGGAMLKAAIAEALNRREPK